jgi:hypothetical protein
MIDYPILHLDTNQSKGTTCSEKGYGYKSLILHLNTN